MPDNERKNIPQKTYDIDVTIKGINYTNDLSGFKMVSSLLSPYQIVELDLLVDPNDIILEELYGQDPIKARVRTHGAGDEMLEEIDLDLMMLDTSYSLTNKEQISDGKEKDLQPLNIKTVCRKPFETMTSLVNEVYIGTTVREVLQDLVENKVGAKLFYDQEGENTEVINQMVIPPITLYKIIKETEEGGDAEGFIDKVVGLFNGVPGVFCDYQNNVRIKNLSSRIRKSQTLTIYHLSDEDDTESQIEDSVAGDTFYTYTPISTSYGGNKKLAMISNNISFVRKPTDALYQIDDYKLTDIAKKYGLVEKSKDLKISQSINKRHKYVTNKNCNNYSEVFLNSRLSRLVANLSNIELTINGRFQMENLMKVGDSVKFKPRTTEYSDLSGKYILLASSIDLSRADNQGTQWASEANLRLIRSVV